MLRSFGLMFGILALALTSLPAYAAHGGFDVLVDESLVPCTSASPVPPIFATVQEGVDAAGPGDRIGVCPGTYAEQVLVATGGLTIEGIGVVNVVAPASTAPRFGYDVTGNGVTIQRFHVSGFTGSESCGIRINGGDEASVVNNTVQENAVGICLLGSTGTRVRNNLVQDNTMTGGGDGNGIRIRLGADNEVANNTVLSNDVIGIVDEAGTASNIHHNVSAGNGAHGVFLNSSANPVVMNNTVRDNPVSGVTAGPFTTGVSIELNNTNRNGTGIHVFSSTDCLIRRNATSSNLTEGINVRDVATCTVGRNQTHRNGRDGIFALDLRPGNVFERNSAAHNGRFDCNWDGSDAPTFTGNACGTENPPGVW
jgi:parallel beta-helix repeat protein